jgi:undecaprenyl-diphosphatase
VKLKIGKAWLSGVLIGLAIAVGFLLFFGWLASEVFEGETHLFDETVRNFIHGLSTPTLTALMKFVSFLGSPLLLVIVGVVVVGVMFYLKLRRDAILFLITMGGEIALDLALKPFYGRVRPEPFFGYALPASYGFPSGHALGSLCFYGILASILAGHVSDMRAKLAIAISAFVVVFFIGLSRIYLGVHYPSDVVAGYSVGLFWIAVVLFGERFRTSTSA